MICVLKWCLLLNVVNKTLPSFFNSSTLPWIATMQWVFHRHLEEQQGLPSEC